MIVFLLLSTVGSMIARMRDLWSNCNGYSNSRNNVYGAVIIAVNCRCQSLPSSFGQSSTSARRLSTFAPDRSIWTSDLPVGSYKYYTIYRHFNTTQPESWYSFYRPAEGKRMSRPSWLASYWDASPSHRHSPI